MKQKQKIESENERERENGSESRSMDSLRFLLSSPMHACLAVEEANRLMTSKITPSLLFLFLLLTCYDQVWFLAMIALH